MSFFFNLLLIYGPISDITYFFLLNCYYFVVYKDFIKFHTKSNLDLHRLFTRQRCKEGLCDGDPNDPIKLFCCWFRLLAILREFENTLEGIFVSSFVLSILFLCDHLFRSIWNINLFFVYLFVGLGTVTWVVYLSNKCIWPVIQ